MNLDRFDNITFSNIHNGSNGSNHYDHSTAAVFTALAMGQFGAVTTCPDRITVTVWVVTVPQCLHVTKNMTQTGLEQPKQVWTPVQVESQSLQSWNILGTLLLIHIPRESPIVTQMEPKPLSFSGPWISFTQIGLFITVLMIHRTNPLLFPHKRSIEESIRGCNHS